MNIWSRNGDKVVTHIGNNEIAIVKREQRKSYTTGTATISYIDKYYCISGCKKRFQKLRDAKRYAEKRIIPTMTH